MPSDADLPPTQRIIPTPAAAPVAVVDPATNVAVDPAWMTRFEDRLRSLQITMTIVGIIAVAGLAVAIYALIHDKPSNDSASAQHVAALDSRVSQLEGKASASPTSTTTDALASRLSQKANEADFQKVSTEVSQLQTAVTKAASTQSSTSSAVGTLKGRVDQLAQQVSGLASQPTSTTTTTPTPTATTP